MAAYPRVGDLEIDQDLEHEKKAAVVRKAGWVLMTLTVLAGLGGLFGRSGPLNRTHTGESGPLVLEHERFTRLQTETTVTAYLRPPAGTREARLWVERSYIDDMQIDGIVPEPDRIETGADRLVLVFPLAPPDPSGAGPGVLQVDFHLQPQGMGPAQGRVGMEGGAELELRQFVYP
jgi:hypothetical protein